MQESEDTVRPETWLGGACAKDGTSSYIYQAERGEKNITVLNLGKIVTALEITSDKLLIDEKTENTSEGGTDKVVQVIQDCTEEMLDELRKI